MEPAEAVWEAFLKLDEAFAAKDVAAVVAGFTKDADLTLWLSLIHI